MRGIFLSIAVLGLTASAFGQRAGTYYSLGGFGNILYPGTGHAPTAPPGGLPGTSFANRFGATVAGRPVFTGPVHVGHQQHRRTVIVPYPVYYGGYGYGYDPSVGAGYQEQVQQLPPIINTNTAPSVVINQGYVPPQASPQVRDYEPEAQQPEQQSSMRVYQNTSHPYEETQPAQGLRAVDAQPTIYLIAFRDHSIVQALGYWMEGTTLHYVSVEHTLNQASLDLIDRDLSQRLNDERKVEFKLPQVAN